MQIDPLIILSIVSFLLLIGSFSLIHKAYWSPKLHPIEQAAKTFAIKAHKAANCKYDKTRPYSFHLQMVRDYAFKYRDLLPENLRATIYAACWVHDTIEDARQTWNDVCKALGKDIAELAYALTNDKGRTREERAGDNYYKGIKETDFADFVKICDRLANIKYSAETESRMLKKYKAEYPHFKSKLYFQPYEEMFIEMEELLEINNSEQK